MKNNDLKEGMKVSVISIIGNVFLFIFKFIAGIIGKSNAMISDSIHSLSDVLSTIVVMIGLKLASKKEDVSHPYGHERIECVASFILAIFLFITGLGIGWMGIKTIFFENYSEIKTPTLIALIAAIISIITKEAMYWYTRSVAKKIKSDALMADAWHHRSDALSSIGSLIGIGGAMMGYAILDSVASLVICIFIAKAAYDIFMDAVDKMVDHACDDSTEEAIRQCALQTQGVLGIDLLRTRVFGNKIYVDMEICADGNGTLTESHAIAEQVHDRIETQFPKVKHIMVHVNPAD